MGINIKRISKDSNNTYPGLYGTDANTKIIVIMFSENHGCVLDGGNSIGYKTGDILKELPVKFTLIKDDIKIKNN